MTQTTESGTACEIPGAAGQTVRGNVHLPAARDLEDGPAPLVLLLHGFKGYKDYGFFPHLAAAVARAGFAACRFNFSHSGIGDDPSTFGQPELFEQDAWSKQLQDVQHVIAAAEAGELPESDHIDASRIALVGHSRGGVVALLTGGSDRRINAVAALASPASSDTLSDQDKQTIRQQGFLVSPSARTGQDLHVGRAWLEDIENNPDKLDVLAAVGRMTCPLLLIHGTSDASVPVQCADEIAAVYPHVPEKLILGGVNHVFNTRNPFTGPSPALEQMMTVLTHFLQQHMKGE